MQSVTFEPLTSGISRFTLPQHSHVDPDANQLFRTVDPIDGSHRDEFEQHLKENNISIKSISVGDLANVSGAVAVKETVKGKSHYYMTRKQLYEKAGAEDVGISQQMGRGGKPLPKFAVVNLGDDG